MDLRELLSPLKKPKWFHGSNIAQSRFQAENFM